MKTRLTGLAVAALVCLLLAACNSPAASTEEPVSSEVPAAATPEPATPEPATPEPATPAPTDPTAPEGTPVGEPSEEDLTELYRYNDMCLRTSGDLLYLRKGAYYSAIPYPYLEDAIYAFGDAWQGFGMAEDEVVLSIGHADYWGKIPCFRWNGTQWEEVDHTDILAAHLDGVLDREQTEQYRKAQDLASLLFGGDASQIIGLNGGTETAPEQEYTQGDWTYSAANGLYARWEDLQNDVLQYFTADWWAQRNGDNSEYPPIYVEHNGYTYTLGSQYGDNDYNPRFPDTYRLVEKTEDKIVFTVTGHYSSKFPNEGETLEERDQRLETAPDYTISFPVTMVRTEDGWRFQEFHVPADPSDAGSMGLDAQIPYYPESSMTDLYSDDALRLLQYEGQYYLRKGDFIGPLLYPVEEGILFCAGGCWQEFGAADEECVVSIARGESVWAETHCLRWTDHQWQEVDRADILASQLDGVLDREQAEQYLQAQDLAILLFGGDASKIRGLPGGTETAPEQQYTQGDWTYSAANGLYARWEDLQKAVLQYFTADWWGQRNGEDSEYPPTYVEHNGFTYTLGSQYGDSYYNPRFPDTYTLTEKTEDRIIFTVTGHYSMNVPYGNETLEERDRRVETAPDWTVDYPINMVCTEDGWRFQAFHVPADPTEAAVYGREAEQAWIDAHTN